MKDYSWYSKAQLLMMLKQQLHPGLKQSQDSGFVSPSHELSALLCVERNF